MKVMAGAEHSPWVQAVPCSLREKGIEPENTFNYLSPFRKWAY